MLAATDADSPSVLQVRTENVAPEHLAPMLLSGLDRYKDQLAEGALVTCDEWHARVRILPFRRQD